MTLSKYILGILLVFRCLAFSQDGSFSAIVEAPSQPIFLDQEVHIILHLTYPEGYTVNSNHLIENLFRNTAFTPPTFTLKEPPSRIKKNENGQIQENISFILQPITPGSHLLSFLNISFNPNDAKKESQNYITNPFSIEVRLPHSSINQIEPLPPLDLSPQLPVSLSPKNQRELSQNLNAATVKSSAIHNFEKRTFPWEKIGLALLGLLIGLIIWMILKDQSVPVPALEKKEENAVKALEILQKSDLLKNQQLTQFMQQLDQIFKQYLEEQRGIHAYSMTTDELLKTVQVPEIQKFLIKSDQIKFAGYLPSLEDCRDAEKLVYSQIKK